MLFSIISSLMQLVSGSTSIIEQFIHAYGYMALFIAMALESSSIPVPSEVVMPFAGALSHAGIFNFWVAFIAALAGSILGLAVDYYIGYFIGKDIVYKHLNLFRVKKSTLDNFDEWFDRNRIAVVFLSRFIPVFRTVMSIPAGFARMDKKAFFAYSIAGTCIWDIALMAIGFYTVNSTTTPSSAIFAMTIAGVMVLAVYLIYKYSKVHSRRNK